MNSNTDEVEHPDVSTKRERTLLWNPRSLYTDYKLAPEDEYMISEQFFKKYTSIQDNKHYRPDPMKDSFLLKEYKVEPFCFYNFSNREECVSSLKCQFLRDQYFYLLDYSKSEHAQIKRLQEIHEDENEENKMCIREIVKRKKKSIRYIENIMFAIDEIVYYAQDASDHFDKMYKTIRNNQN